MGMRATPLNARAFLQHDLFTWECEQLPIMLVPSCKHEQLRGLAGMRATPYNARGWHSPGTSQENVSLLCDKGSRKKKVWARLASRNWETAQSTMSSV